MTAGRPSRPAGPRDLTGAYVAVVGATGALGSQLVDLLHAHGAVVSVVGRDAQRLWPLARGGSVVVGDLTDDTLGDRLVATVEEHDDGRLDGLVNGAGVVAFGPSAEVPDEVTEQLLLTNLLGPLWLLRRTVPLLQASHGFLAPITGAVAEQAFPGMAAYGASKAGLAAASASLARELRRDGSTSSTCAHRTPRPGWPTVPSPVRPRPCAPGSTRTTWPPGSCVPSSTGRASWGRPTSRRAPRQV